MSKIGTATSIQGSAGMTPSIASELIRSQINTSNTQNKGETHRNYNPFNNFSYGDADQLTRQTLQRSGWNETQINDFINRGEEIKFDDNQEPVTPRINENTRINPLSEQPSSAGENDTTIHNISVDSDLDNTIQQLLQLNGMNDLDSLSQTEFNAFQSSDEIEMTSLINSNLINPNPEVLQGEPEMLTFRQMVGMVLLQRLSQLTMDDVRLIIEKIIWLYNKWQEFREFGNGQGRGDNISQINDSSDSQVEVFDVHKLQSKAIPKHCRRHIYYDNQGRLRSVVICQADENSEPTVYHEQ